MSISVTRLVLATVAASLLAPRADAGICVDVELHSGNPALSRDLIAALEHEATAIWAPYGVDLHWQLLGCAVQDASFDVLIERHLSSASTDRKVLGTTQVQMAPIDRVPILIDYDATEQTLASLTMGALEDVLGRQHIGPQDMGRALGRVVSHEIGHVLLALPNHQRQGLMRESFQAINLICPLRQQYRLSAIEVARLRHRAQWIIANRNHAAPPDPQDNVPEHRLRDEGPSSSVEK